MDFLLTAIAKLSHNERHKSSTAEGSPRCCHCSGSLPASSAGLSRLEQLVFFNLFFFSPLMSKHWSCIKDLSKGVSSRPPTSRAVGSAQAQSPGRRDSTSPSTHSLQLSPLGVSEGLQGNQGMARMVNGDLPVFGMSFLYHSPSAEVYKPGVPSFV